MARSEACVNLNFSEQRMLQQTYLSLETCFRIEVEQSAATQCPSTTAASTVNSKK